MVMYRVPSTQDNVGVPPETLYADGIFLVDPGSGSRYGNLASVTPVGSHTQVTVTSGATASFAVPQGASKLFLGTSQNIRITYDGSAPTATRGFSITSAFGPVAIAVGSGATIRALAEGTSALVDYQWSV